MVGVGGTGAGGAAHPVDEVEPERAAHIEVAALLPRRARSSGWRWAGLALSLVLIGGWSLVAGRGLTRDASLVRSPLLGKPAPAFRLALLDGGGQLDSASLRGDVVVLNFWASWCAPCVEEAPELQAFADRWSNRGVKMVGVVFSDEEAKAAAFRARFGLTYPQLMDPGGRTAIDFGIFGIPETYVIDSNGIVMAKLIGAVDTATLEGVVASVKEGRTVSERNDRYRTGPGR